MCSSDLFEAARRGLVAPVPDGMVRAKSGTVLWNLGEYAFIDGELAPATVNPSLWRLARLNMANGLFKVAERVYQLRGFDIANMTVLEGETGFRLRHSPATPVTRTVLLTRDIIKMFDGLIVAESVLLKSNTRETLFRRP